MTVNITESAQTYLKELLAMFVSNPGTSQAETCIAYSRPGEEQDEDEKVEYTEFTAYFEGRSLPFLKDAKVDYSADQMGGQLTIRAPNSKMPLKTELTMYFITMLTLVWHLMAVK